MIVNRDFIHTAFTDNIKPALQANLSKKTIKQLKKEKKIKCNNLDAAKH